MKILRPGRLRFLVSACLLTLVILLALWLLRRPSARPRSNVGGTNGPILPAEAQKALERGRVAANLAQEASKNRPNSSQELWAVAVKEFDAARKLASLAPEPLYLLGLAEAQVPGRELRATCWLEAYLALSPRSEKADQTRAIIDNELQAKAQRNLEHINQVLKALADKMDFDEYRKSEIESLDKLEQRENDVVNQFTGSTAPSQSQLFMAFADWQAQRWIALVDEHMDIPIFLDFDRAVTNAAEGHPLRDRKGRYMPDYIDFYEGMDLRIHEPWPTHAQEQFNDNFRSVLRIADDVLAAIGDVLNTRKILTELKPVLNRSDIKSILGPWLCAKPFSDGLTIVSNFPSEVSGDNAYGDAMTGDYRRCGDWGVINRDGMFLIPAKLRADPFLHLHQFHEGLLAVTAWQYELLIWTRHDTFWNIAKCQGNQRVLSCLGLRSDAWGFIDRSGTTVLRPRWKEVRDFSDGLAAVTDGSKWGYIDKSDRLVIPLSFAEARDFSEGMAAVVINEVRRDIPDRKDQCFINRQWGFVDKSGHMIISPSSDWDDVSPFSDGLAAVRKDDKWGFIDRSGHMVVAATWDAVNGTDWGYEKRCGKQWKWVLNPEKPFSEGLAAVRKDDRWGFIDKKLGKLLFQFRSAMADLRTSLMVSLWFHLAAGVQATHTTVRKAALSIRRARY
ncbi:MAG TPA: WG repeat-containing protein [Candidatus Angelobacter sp.]